jgi:hypothetical protein
MDVLETGAETEMLRATDIQVAEDGFEWAICEIFGHRRHAGRCREEERFGAKMLRIDIPLKGDPAANGWETHFYSGGSIISYTLTDEATVMRTNRPYERPAPYRLEPPVAEPSEDHDDDMFDGN